MASKPEPAPVNKGKPVPDLLIQWLETQKSSEDAIALIKARDLFGRKKYGQPLMTGDGRNTIEDAVQELGDLMQYVYKAKVNGENLDKVKKIVPYLLELLNSK